MQTKAASSSARNPWAWIPSLYFAQGIPYFAVMYLSGVMYKNLGVSNTDLALYTGWLYLPWVIKPLWSPFIDMFRTKRAWTVAMQILIGAALASVALTVRLPVFLQATLALFWLMAFASATHDIAADGFYMLSLPDHQQAAFVGVRSTFYRLSTLVGQGGLLMLAGKLIAMTGDTALAWSIVMFVLAAMFTALGFYHWFVLPRPAADHPTRQQGNVTGDFVSTFASYFKKPQIAVILAFLLLYRFGEAQMLRMATPFLLDPPDKGGLGLTNVEVGFAYGTVGVIALTLGGLFGGYMISRFGLKRMLWIMVCATHLPNLVFVYMAMTQPASHLLVAGLLSVEQFGYGFGFTAYLMYMIMVSEGANKTAHYAICTGFMALGMMLPGMASGWIQSQLGYMNFFVWVCLATLPAFAAAAFIKVDPAFGKKK